MSYPARIAQTRSGRGLLAERDLPAGEAVARFEGPLVARFEDVPESEVCYAIWIGPDQWLIPESTARFVNHACDPNCTVNDDLEVVSLRPVRRDEELTISYNTVRPGEELPEWDPRWSFPCQCGAAQCLGRVDGWTYQEGRQNRD